MHRSVLASLAVIVSALPVACGPGILSPATPPTPAFHVEVTAAGSLTAAGDVRGALAWAVYSDELVACMDQVDVDGLIEVDSELDPDLALIEQMRLCLNFSERGHVETDSVAVEPQFPSSFTIPVAALPSTDVLTGDEGARLGIGDVVVYLDDDADGAFSETPLGASAFVDRVVGTSLPYREEDTDVSFLVWREGALSSVWKFYRGIYGCPDPDEGFSTVTVRLIDDAPYVECVIDQAPIAVELDDSALGSLACAADPDAHVPQRPQEATGIPAGAVVECVPADGWYDLVYTVDTTSVCPDLDRYDLVGCSDLSSESACHDSAWDLVGQQPSWWPCGFNGELSFTVDDADDELSDDIDALFALHLVEGFASLAPADLLVVIETPNGEVALSGEALALDDRDGNGVLSVGDTLTVSELDGASFTAATLPGAYPVRLFHDGVEIADRFVRAWWPQPVFEPAPITVSALDAAATLSYGADDIATVTWEAVFHEPVAVEDVAVRCYVGGELPVAFGRGGQPASDDDGELVLVDDADGDGLFSLGDTLLMRELVNIAFGLDPEGFATFGGLLYCSMELDVGFNAFVNVANWTVGLDGTISPISVSSVDAPAPLSFDADDVASVTWDAVAHEPVAVEDVFVQCYLAFEEPVAFGPGAQGVDGAGDLILTDDVDGDGLFSLGDTLLLRERENAASVLDPDGLASFGGLLYCAMSFDVGADDLVGVTTWTVTLDEPAQP